MCRLSEFAPGFLGDPVGADERGTDAETAGTGLEEGLRGGQIHAAGGHEADLGQRSAQGFEVVRPSDIGREDFDDIGSCLPGGEDLGGGEGAGHDHSAVASGQADDIQVDDWGDEELSTGEEGVASRFGIEDGTGTEDDAVSERAANGRDHLIGAGHGVGDFDRLESAGEEGLGHVDQGFGV